jgi:hypothetical protein
MKKTEREELVDKLLMRMVLFTHHPDKTGEVIRKLPDEDRENLKYLTGDDFQRRIK